MFLDVGSLLKSVFEDLCQVNYTGPNERLPKEEQIRCCVYHLLKPTTNIVCAERGYRPVEDKNYQECDIWAKKGSDQIWLELKTCRSKKGCKNKPSEELQKWKHDIGKLRLAPKDSFRYFFLVGYFDFDPMQFPQPAIRKGSVLSNIIGLYPKFRVVNDSKTFSWRQQSWGGWSPGVSHICAWVWLWRKGQTVH